MKALRRTLAIALFLCVMGGLFYFTRSNELGIEGETYDWKAYIGTSVLLIAGIVFGSLYRRLMRLEDTTVNIWRELLAVFGEKAFWSAILVSPFAFGSVYMFLSTQPEDLVAFLFAFENGFFCEGIFRELHARRLADSTQPAAST